jgi:HAD superfamily hydrolase (TIGR01549 family)
MIKAVLFDLDNTLLGNDPNPFTRRYLALLDDFVQQRLGTPSILEALWAGTRAVLADADPLRTNAERFYDAFMSLVSTDRAAFARAMQEFYTELYPTLEALTQQRPGARRLLEQLLSGGYAVVIATNPLFPEVAVRYRLAWAGVPMDQVPLTLVTTLDNMRFAKPHPAYYEEIIARLGLAAHEAIMVGDDWEHDILPARAAGLNTFWVCGDGQGCDTAAARQVDGCGSLADFAGRVSEERWLEIVAPRPLEPAQIAPRLTANIAALDSLIRETPSEAWNIHPTAGEWSPLEVLGHLLVTEREVYRPRLQTILSADTPVLAALAEAPAPTIPSGAERPRALLELFVAERRATLDLLATLAPADWQRPAYHHRLGLTTLLAVADLIAQHDRQHLRQIRETLARCC